MPKRLRFHTRAEGTPGFVLFPLLRSRANKPPNKPHRGAIVYTSLRARVEARKSWPSSPHDPPIRDCPSVIAPLYGRADRVVPGTQDRGLEVGFAAPPRLLSLGMLASS